MAEPLHDLPESAPQANESEAIKAEDLYGLSRELTRDILDALLDGRTDDVRALVTTLHYADAADLLERLSPQDRVAVVQALGADLDPDILPELDADIRDEVLEVLGLSSVAAAVQELDSDDAVHLMGHMEEDERRKVLDALPATDQAIIEQGLSYGEYTAGRLMQREMAVVPDYWTVGEAIDHMRSDGAQMPEEFFELFVVDPRHRPTGMVKLSKLVRTHRPIKLKDIVNPDIRVIPVDMDQEEVAFLFRQHNLVSAPVVDPSGRLVGRVTVDDVVDVIDEEAADDMLRLAGVAEGDLYAAVIDTTRSRFSWLLLNLGTAIVASLVIGLFQAEIEAVVALAVLMPIVASMGGNAGTQTLAVAVRALAMKELTGTNAVRVVGKEVLVGLLNGLMFAVLTGAVAWVWFDQPRIGAIIGAAMVINLVSAGLAGILIPLALDRLKVDPAVSSSVFLTTITDVVGFLAFLGLAALFLL